jgi:hypothetical protein
MKIGTRTVLYGAHSWFLHPWFVALAWWRLYGFPFDPRLWIAFFVHDLGYIGKADLDGPDGERHVEFGAKLMSKLFDRRERGDFKFIILNFPGETPHAIGTWGQLCLFHSRFYAKRFSFPFSRLCVADKLAIVLTPRWIAEPLMRLTGEWTYFEALHADPKSKYADEPRFDGRDWYDQIIVYCRKWVAEHSDGRQDTWTLKAQSHE